MPGMVIRSVELVLALAQPFAEHGVIVGEALGGVVEGVQQVVQDEAAGLVELGAQGVAQLLGARAHMMRERGEDGVARLARDEPFEDAGAVGAEQVREDPPDADPGGVEDLVDAVARAGTLAHHLTAHARDFAQGAKLRRRDEARRTQTELADACEPHAVGDVGLAAPELLDVLGVHEQRLDARVFERLPGGFPVNAGALHDRGAHRVGAQPIDERGQAAGQGAELAGEHLGLGAGVGHAHRGRDLHLVHVEPCCARVDDVHRVGAYHRTSSCGGVRVEAEAGTFGQPTHIADTMRRVLLCVHGRTGNNAGREAVGRDSFEPGTQAPKKRRPLARFRLRSSSLPDDQTTTERAPNNERTRRHRRSTRYMTGGVCGSPRSWEFCCVTDPEIRRAGTSGSGMLSEGW